MDELLPPSFLKTFQSMGITGQSDSWKIEEKDLKIIVTLTWNASQEIEAKHPKSDKIQKKSLKKQKAASEGTKAANELTKTNTAVNEYIQSWLKSQTSAASKNVTTEVEQTLRCMETAKENLSKESASTTPCEEQITFENKPRVLVPELENVHCVSLVEEEVSRGTNNREMEIKMESIESDILWAETERYDSASLISDTSISDSKGTVAMKQEPYHKSVDPEPITENSKILTYSSKDEQTYEGIKIVEIEPSEIEPEVTGMKSNDDRQSVSTRPTDLTQKEISRTVGQKPGHHIGQNKTPFSDRPVEQPNFGDTANRETFNHFHKPHAIKNKYGRQKPGYHFGQNNVPLFCDSSIQQPNFGDSANRETFNHFQQAHVTENKYGNNNQQHGAHLTVGQKPGYYFGQNKPPFCNRPVWEHNSSDTATRVSSYHFHQPRAIENKYGRHTYFTKYSNTNQQHGAHLTTHSQTAGGQGKLKQKGLPERPPFLKSLNQVLTEKEIDKQVEKFGKKLRKQRKWIPDPYHRHYSYEDREIDGFKRRIRAVNQWLIVKRRFDQSRSKVEGQRSLEIVPEVLSSSSDSDSDREPNFKGTSKKKHKSDPNRPPFLKSINRDLNEDELEDRIKKFSGKVNYENRWIPAHVKSYAKNEIDGFRRRIMSLNYWHIERKRFTDTAQESGKSTNSLPKSESSQSSSSSDSGNGSNSERRKSKKTAKRRKKELQNEKPAKCRKTDD